MGTKFRPWVFSVHVCLCNWNSLPGVSASLPIDIKPSFSARHNKESKTTTPASVSRKTVQNCCFPWNMSLETKGEYSGQTKSLCQLCSSVFAFLTYLNICFTMKELPHFDNIGNISLSFLRDFNEHWSSVGRGYRTICLYFVRSPHFLACVGCVHGMKKTITMFVLIYTALVISLVATKSAAPTFTEDK